MKPVDRSEVLDYVSYGEQREQIRASALHAKSVRRILVGEYFTFLFENRETVRYQVQEMMRIERIVKEADIQHELDTYNELIHPKGTVGCTLMVGIDDEAERDVKLRAWLGLNEHIYAKLARRHSGAANLGPSAGGRRSPLFGAVPFVRHRRRRRPSPSASECLESKRKPSSPGPSERRSAKI